MKIKRYVVRNMQEALGLIRRDLGPDAVIISTRKVRERGLRGYFTPKKLEVTAAVDSKTGRVEKKQETLQNKLEQEVAEMKQMLHKLTMGSQQEMPSARRWRELLLEAEISEEVTNYLLRQVAAGEGDDSQQQQKLVEEMTALLEKKLPARSNIITFVGPTGVGKTTTMAKLAAQFALYQNKNVAMVTIDTYRIGAVEQLKTYGEIMGIPLDVVMTPRELKQIVDKHDDKDVILIDTAGRPSKNHMQIRELRGFLDQIEPVETCLVLSCTTRGKDLLRIAEDFKETNYKSLIFTKVDETDILGPIVDVVYRTSVPVRYITSGQNVPDDIEEATPEKLAKMILGAASNA